MLCSFPGCDNPASPKVARGLCNSHYWQLHKGRELTPLSYRRNRCIPWIEEHAAFDGDDCLIWPFKSRSGGRGMVKWKGRYRIVSRIMCEMAHGAPPSPRHAAAHSCGHGHLGCVNPKHLRWATAKENSADMVAHGTAPRGENQGAHKVTTTQVLEMRALPPGIPHRKIGMMFGISASQVGRILHRERWEHV